ncbi:hypothetical protein KC19_VG184800 [Ceratodon purpureus]|uniref:Uncharacterized protein n=1 Tax=Ceratodon purpureus TaxID=3225 RepID=A0A8T0HRE2_CERPU|nr:hypothetical protein KC19_VG184800 [Ceratodon purpureus]
MEIITNEELSFASKLLSSLHQRLFTFQLAAALRQIQPTSTQLPNCNQLLLFEPPQLLPNSHLFQISQLPVSSKQRRLCNCSPLCTLNSAFNNLSPATSSSKLLLSQTQPDTTQRSSCFGSTAHTAA